MTVTESVEGQERYPVNIRYPSDYRGSPDQLRSLPVITPGGAQIPLGRIADISIGAGPGVIRSENARLNGWVYVDIAGVDIGTYVAGAQRTLSDQLDLPPGYSIRWSGQYEFMERAKAKLAVVVPVTLVIIVLLLFLNFRRLIPVLLIIGTLADRRKLAADEGRELRPDDLTAAVTEGALLRVRPIMMTVAVIIAGLLPIMLGSGTGSEVMRRIAAPMVGGMISATILTLLVIPAAFLIWQSVILGQPRHRRTEGVPGES